MKRPTLPLGLALALMSGMSAHAEERVDIQFFHPMPAQQGNYLGLASGQNLRNGEWELGLLAHHAAQSLVFRRTDAGSRGDIVDHQTTTNLFFGVGFLDRVDVQFDLPLYLFQSGDEVPLISGYDEPDVGFGIGDARIIPKVNLFDTARKHTDGHGLAMSLLADFYVPLGDDRVYQGDGPRIHPRIAMDFGTRKGHRVGLNVGYLWRPSDTLLNLNIDDMVSFGVASDIRVAEHFHLVPELRGMTQVIARPVSAEETPVEARLAGRFPVFEGFMMQLGGGTGVVQGLGAPAWRAFAGLSYTRHAGSRDNDGDGIPNKDDQCRNEAEDLDAWEDGDGCPDPDNDGDLIFDIYDECPNAREVVNGFADHDGCPDTVPVVENTPKACVELKLNGRIFFDFNRDTLQSRSKPVLDDLVDQLESQPDILVTLVAGHTDWIGRLAYNEDLAKRRATSVARYLFSKGIEAHRIETRGFGETQPVATNRTAAGRAMNRRVEVAILEHTADVERCPLTENDLPVCTEIELDGRVLFHFGQDTVQTRSLPVLQRLVQRLHDYPNVTLMLVEGHTDSVGSYEVNLDLSERRAASVRRYLVSSGIDGERITTQGFGETKPISTNATAAGRAQNRRVEVLVLEQDPCRTLDGGAR